MGLYIRFTCSCKWGEKGKEMWLGREKRGDRGFFITCSTGCRQIGHVNKVEESYRVHRRVYFILVNLVKYE